MNAVTAVESSAVQTTINQAAADALQPGDAIGGGFYAGKIRKANGVHIVIVSPKDGGEHDDIAWNSSRACVDGAVSYFDGRANTMAMAEAGSEIAKWALGLQINGLHDWYLPARDEKEVIYRNLKPTSESNYVYRSGDNPSSVPAGYPYTETNPTQTAAAAFQAGGMEAFDGEFYYWTSTQSESYSDGAWLQSFGSGSQSYSHESYEFRARAVRRVAAQ